MDATQLILTNTTLIPDNDQTGTISTHQPASDILRDWLQRHSENTRRAYAQDLQAFQRFLVSLGLEIHSTEMAQNALRRAQGKERGPRQRGPISMEAAGIEPLAGGEHEGNTDDTETDIQGTIRDSRGGSWKVIKDTTDTQQNALSGGQEHSENGYIMGDLGEMPEELKAVIEAWPKLPEVIRSAILGMVEASAGPSIEKSKDCRARNRPMV